MPRELSKEENHVTSLKLSQELKEAGFPQDTSLFVYVQTTPILSNGWCDEPVFRSSVNLIIYKDWCAAPIATEIEFEDAVWEYWPTGSFTLYLQDHTERTVIGDSFPNARAQMWLNHPETRGE